MSIYAQEGWGKSNRIARGIQDGSIAGVIWSPRDEDLQVLPLTISRYRSTYPAIVMLIDPQFYATTLVGPDLRERHLPKYPYYRHGLSQASFNNLQNIQDFVRDTLEYQSNLNVNRLISPTISVANLSDRWSQIALTMANEAVSYHAIMELAPPLLISLVISETALTSQDALQEYLDELSLLDAQGFYLIVHRNSQIYQASFEPLPLENLLYLVYVLAEVNKFEIVCGYCDFVGLGVHPSDWTGRVRRVWQGSAVSD